MTTFCIGCGRPRGPGEYGCPGCGAAVYSATIQGSPAPRRGRSTEEDLGGVLVDLAWLPPGRVGLIKGPRGSGKTSIALAALRRPWVASSEMGPEDIGEYCHRLGIQVAGYSEIQVTAPDDGDDTRVDLRIGNVNVDVVVDSITSTRHPARALAAAMEHARAHGVRVLVVSQVTHEGAARGGADIEHDVHLVINVLPEGDDRRVVVEKSRSGPEGSRIVRLGRRGAELPVRDRYYSVEGSAPHYRLVPWPSSSSPYADVYRHAEALADDDEASAMPLPPPPVAVTARRSPLYRGGWVEPADVEERARFSELAGVPHWSPTGRSFPSPLSTGVTHGDAH